MFCCSKRVSSTYQLWAYQTIHLNIYQTILLNKIFKGLRIEKSYILFTLTYILLDSASILLPRSTLHATIYALHTVYMRHNTHRADSFPRVLHAWERGKKKKRSTASREQKQKKEKHGYSSWLAPSCLYPFLSTSLSLFLVL